MDAVATRATHAGLAVIGAQKIGMSTRMTAKAGRIDLRRGHLAQLQNLSRVSSGSDVQVQSYLDGTYQATSTIPGVLSDAGHELDIGAVLVTTFSRGN